QILNHCATREAHFILFFSEQLNPWGLFSSVLCILWRSSAEVNYRVAMGDERRMTRMLLECSLSDKLCIVREQQYEIIIIPTLLVGIFLILLGVILWLFIREQREHQQSPGLQGVAHVPPSRDLSWEAARPEGSVFVPLKETSVESLLRTSTHALAKLQVPRQHLSEVLEQIHNGSFGTIYRTKIYTGDPDKPKSVVLKALKEPAGLQEVQKFLGQIRFYQYLGKHKNLVQLEGCCTEGLPLYMVLEDVAQGDLLSFLWTCRRDVMTMDGLPYDLTEKQIYHIGKQVLLAVVRLGEMTTDDTRNILIQCDLTAKLCGLGLAYEVHSRGAISSTRIVPLKWLAPERLLLRPAGIKGDMYGLWYLSELSLRKAEIEIKSMALFLLQLVFWDTALRDGDARFVRRGDSFSCFSCFPFRYSLMKSCWRWSEDSRPSLRELHSRLETAARTANDKAVLQVPELVVPELYAAVAGVSVESLSYSYSVL
ncbi:hypothetical protein J1605_021052, partial [Eschrichtius robustus]